MYRIRRFGVIKTATVVAIMYMVIVGVFVAPFALLGLLIAPSQGGAGTAAGIVAFGLLAIFGYGLLGWVFTAVAAAIYNLAARWVGGIEVEIEHVVPPAPPPVWKSSTAPPAPPPTSAAPPAPNPTDPTAPPAPPAAPPPSAPPAAG
ncbi:MAG: hypothetical protein QOI52_372 [Chloroflexota bacterium]|nr:hypothetical protein [Chloroflexota bacterium]